MEFFHSPDDVSHMLDNVRCTDLVKRAIEKRKWGMIKIRDDISRRMPIAIDPDRTRIFVDPAANVQYRQRPYGCSEQRLRDSGF